jgi:hypothetical protein
MCDFARLAFDIVRRIFCNLTGQIDRAIVDGDFGQSCA